MIHLVDAIWPQFLSFSVKIQKFVWEMLVIRSWRPSKFTRNVKNSCQIKCQFQEKLWIFQKDEFGIKEVVWNPNLITIWLLKPESNLTQDFLNTRSNSNYDTISHQFWLSEVYFVANFWRQDSKMTSLKDQKYSRDL